MSLLGVGVAVVRAEPSVDPESLAVHWAPRIYHDTEANTYPTPRDDYMTRFDFDGDWVATNNKASLDAGIAPLTAVVYYAVIETETHYYLTYAFFHPYDSSVFNPKVAAQGLCITHENDMEGVILTIRKSGGPWGELRVAATEAHGNVYYFKPQGSDVVLGNGHLDPSTSGTSTADSLLYFPEALDEAAVFIEANGHGVGSQNRAMAPDAAGFLTLGSQPYSFRGGNGIVYYHDGSPAEAPTGAALESVRYELRPMDELWSRRHNPVGEAPYCGFLNFAGSRGCELAGLAYSFGGFCSPFGSCAANPPWGWESDAAGSPRGEWFLDPAYAVADLHVPVFPDKSEPGFYDYFSNEYLQGDKQLTLLTPGPGTSWEIGSPAAITWASVAAGQGPALADTVCVELSRDGGPWIEIARGALADGMAAWSVEGPASDGVCLRLRLETDCALELRSASGTFQIVPGSVAVEGEPVPRIRLLPPRPNPFFGSAAFVVEAAEPTTVRLELRSASGRRVRLLENRELSAGRHIVRWDGRDDRGRPVSSGVYFYRLDAGSLTASGRLLRLR